MSYLALIVSQSAGGSHGNSGKPRTSMFMSYRPWKTKSTCNVYFKNLLGNNNNKQ